MVFEDQTLAPYHGSEPYIFVSYSHRNSARAAEIISRLNRSGFRVWYDQGLIPGREWDENIARIIMGCSYFIALLTEEYLASSNCRDELNFARDKDKPLLMIYLDEVALPAGMELRLGRLFAVHRAQYSSDEAFYAKVFSADGLARCNRRYNPSEARRASSASSVRTSASGRSASSRPMPKKAPEPEPAGSSGGFLKVLGALLLLAVLAGTIWYLYSNYSTPTVPQATPAPVQTVAPAVDHEAELDIETTPTPAAESTPVPEVTPDESLLSSPIPTLPPDEAFDPTPSPTLMPTPTPTPAPVPTLMPTPLPAEETVQVVDPTPTPTPTESVVIVESSSDSDTSTVTVISDTARQDTAP